MKNNISDPAVCMLIMSVPFVANFMVELCLQDFNRFKLTQTRMSSIFNIIILVWTPGQSLETEAFAFDGMVSS